MLDDKNLSDNYGGGFEDQRTNQAEMDSLMKPVLDFDDNDEEEDNNILKAAMSKDKGGSE